MLTVKQLIAATQSPPKRRDRTKVPNLFANSKKVQVSWLATSEGKDARGYYRAVKWNARTPQPGKIPKRCELRVYYPKTKAKVDQYIPMTARGGIKYEGPHAAPPITEDAKCWVFCTCEYFLFHCEVADAESDNSSINYRPRSFADSPVTNNNGKAPVITNPNHVAHLCKHLLAGIWMGALLRKAPGQDKATPKYEQRAAQKKTAPQKPATPQKPGQKPEPQRPMSPNKPTPAPKSLKPEPQVHKGWQPGGASTPKK